MRQSLVVQPEPAPRSDLVDFRTTNANIIEQLRMVTRYPYRLPDDMRDKVVDAVDAALSKDMPIDVRLAGVSAVARLTAVNLAVIKQLASDQVQRHLPFSNISVEEEEKQRLLDSMTDEELLQLEQLADKMGGVITIDAKVI